MIERIKYNKNIVTSLLLALICLLFGLVLYTGSGKVKSINVNIDESSRVNYKVYLNDKSDYNKEYLDEGMQYISNLIKDIKIDYKYVANYSDKINVNYENLVDANIKIVDETNNEKVIYEKSENLKTVKNVKKDTDVIEINQKIDIDYQKYNEFANKFKTKNGIQADCKLIVTFTTNQYNNSDYTEKLDKNNSMVIEIPLSEKMIIITKTSDINRKTSSVLSTSTSASNIIEFIGSIILFGLTGLFVLLGIIFAIKKNNSFDEYEKFIYKLLKDYDAYVTESTNIINLKPDTIYVKDFKELLDVRNNVEKAIVYNKINDSETRFVIVDGEQDYCYIVNKRDFE